MNLEKKTKKTISANKNKNGKRLCPETSEIGKQIRPEGLAEFILSLAHEISQPLTAILAYAQAAQRMLAGREPELRDILQYIINDAYRANEVVQRLRPLLKKSVQGIKQLDK